MSSFQGIRIERFHYIQRCTHFRGIGIEVSLYTEVSSFQGDWNRGFTVYRGVLISGDWNRGFTVYRGGIEGLSIALVTSEHLISWKDLCIVDNYTLYCIMLGYLESTDNILDSLSILS